MKSKPIAAGTTLLVALAALFFIPSFESAVTTLISLPAQKVVVVIGGDVMLDRNVAKRAEEFGVAPLFANVSFLFAEADIAVLNLEGTITENPSMARRDSSTLRFTFVPSFAKEALAPLELSAVSLANNHAFDFYREGYDTTKNYLNEWGIGYFGHPLNHEDALSTVLSSKKGTICFVGYHELYEADPETTLREIARIRPNCFKLIVMPHWGEEYEREPRERVRKLAYRFVDAGADAVVGAHPHVVQTLEFHNGRPIFYSLGNFMFDQDFSWETTHGLLLKFSFTDEATEITLIPSSVIYSQAALLSGEERDRVLERLLHGGLSEGQVSAIREGFIRVPLSEIGGDLP